MSVASPPWLLVVHAIPPKPDYLRAKVGKRLARAGAIALKNSVYVLPRRDEAMEDLSWVRREVEAGGGECTILEASVVAGMSNDDLVARFKGARDSDYAAVAIEGDRLRLTLTAPPPLEAADREGVAVELGRLQRRLDEIRAIDWFDAEGGPAATESVRGVELALRALSGPAGDASDGSAEARGRGALWVTRRDLHVDRLASAWLIRRFIDPAARFLFVEASAYTHAEPQRRFDMFEGEYTHEGADCTFETLLRRFALADPALVALGEIVHDLDLKERTFARPETDGVARLIDGLVRSHATDEARLEYALAVFDALYAGFRPSGP